MDLSTALMVGMVTGVFGMAYIAYARKAGRIVPFVSGVVLCVFPYVVNSLWMSILLFLACLAAPFVIQV
jgi:hypothetical protein